MNTRKIWLIVLWIVLVILFTVAFHYMRPHSN